MRPLGWKSPKDTLHDFIKYGVTYVWQTNNSAYLQSNSGPPFLPGCIRWYARHLCSRIRFFSLYLTHIFPWELHPLFSAAIQLFQYPRYHLYPGKFILLLPIYTTSFFYYQYKLFADNCPYEKRRYRWACSSRLVRAWSSQGEFCEWPLLYANNLFYKKVRSNISHGFTYSILLSTRQTTVAVCRQSDDSDDQTGSL